MAADDGNPEPFDDDLPPDPFPGDPFEGRGASEVPGTPSPGDLADLLGRFGQGAGLGGVGGPAFAQILSALGGAKGLMWDAARQVALWTAAGGSVEPNVDPVERIRIEELVRTVLPVVADTTGLEVSAPKVMATTRAGWAAQALDEHRPLLDRLARATASTDAGASSNPVAGMLALLGPTLMSTAIGTLYGQLGAVALGTYETAPVPRPSSTLTLVPASISAFSAEWSLTWEQAATHVAVHDVVMHGILGVAHVRRRLDELLGQWADAARLDADALEERIATMFEGDDPLQSAASMRLGAEFGAPEPTAAQLRVRAEIDDLLVPVYGFAEYALMVAGARLLGDNRQVVEAWRRRRSGADSSVQVANLLGISAPLELCERGAVFVGGVLQRAGRSGLEALWSREEHLPTRAELDAPGLWLARLETQ